MLSSVCRYSTILLASFVFNKKASNLSCGHFLSRESCTCCCKMCAKNTMDKTEPTPQPTSLISLISHNVFSTSLGGDFPPAGIKSDRDTFKEKANAGIIDINNTSPAYTVSIWVRFWGSMRPDTFRNNFCTRAAVLQTQREATGQRTGSKSFCVFACAHHFH